MTRKALGVRFILFALIVLAAFTTVIMRYAQRRMREQQLDQALSVGVERNDPAAVRQALAQGADADARRIGTGPVTFWSAVSELFNRPPESALQTRLTPLGTACNYLPAVDGPVTFGEPRKEHIEVMKLLLDHGANPNRGFPPPLCMATDLAFVESVKLLMDRGALVSKTGIGIFPIFNAVKNSSRPAVLQVLLEHGVDPNTRAEGGKTPLMDAVVSAWPENVRMLIDHGANVNARDSKGRTALTIVLADQAKRGRPLTAQEIQYNDRMNKQLNPHPTAAQLASRKRDKAKGMVANQQQYDRDTKIIAMLRAAGARP